MNQLSASLSVISSEENASYYFMDEQHPLLNSKFNYHRNGLEGYSNVFPKQVGKYLLDGTDHLMYQLSMVDVINQLPNKKMIFIFREPSERIYSSFNYTKNNLGNFKIDVSFKMYVNALKEKNNQLIQSWMYSSKQSGFVLANELDYSHYHLFVERWIEVIGKENMIFLSFDEMKKEEDLFFNDLMNKLKIDYWSKVGKEKNESYNIKNKFIYQQVKNIAVWFPQSKMKEIVKRMYFNSQKEILKRTKEDELQIKELKKIFINSNKKLERLTNLDLSSWE